MGPTQSLLQWLVTGFIPWDKEAGGWCWPPTSIYCWGYEWVELYLCSLRTPAMHVLTFLYGWLEFSKLGTDCSKGRLLQPSLFLGLFVLYELRPVTLSISGTLLLLLLCCCSVFLSCAYVLNCCGIKFAMVYGLWTSLPCGEFSIFMSHRWVCPALLCLTAWCVQHFYVLPFDVSSTFMSHRLTCPALLCLTVWCVQHFYVPPFGVSSTFMSHRLAYPTLLCLTILCVQRVAKRLSYIEDARCLKVETFSHTWCYPLSNG